ncbi:YibE/F family protein [Corynebacterium crudilactis]|uniref:YibE/F family protein n=1 Tax=Corynebacterium crudilactis TaxID=1652495 RepID=A0A172QWH3_9CORY|nr:YibE/F family protein [Corynebacterium crudilactis]ANE04996.1 YibE/F family protein [Corynebacterium crudilactis]
MGKHATASTTSKRSPWRVGLLTFLVSSVIVTLVGMVMLWPNSDDVVLADNFSQTFAGNHEQVDGTITLVDGAACNSPDTGRAFSGSPTIPLESATLECVRALVDITSGINEGQKTQLITYAQPGEPEFAEGDKIRMVETPDANGGIIYTFADFQRGIALVVWGIVLILAMGTFAAWRGVRALFGLVITLGIVGIFLLPGLASGHDAMWLALICGATILLIVVPMVHGLNWKSAAALAGTLVALVLSAVLSWAAIVTTNLRGLGDENHLKIINYLPEVSISGLLLASFIIGTLGVLNDVTISQASTINELAEIDDDATPWRLFTGAMSVGRDHISSMIYTLVLGYTGAALPLLLLLSLAERPLIQTLTSDVMAGELLRSGVGALTLTLAVPITTLIAAWTVPGDEPAPRDDSKPRLVHRH